MIATFKEEYKKDIIALWNEVATKIGYKELNDKTFKEIFTYNIYFTFYPIKTFMYIKNSFFIILINK